MKKTILITGASGGIGRDAALLFGAKGYRLVLTARSVDALEAVKSVIEASGGQADVIPCDLADNSGAETLFAETEKMGILPDVVVNNAGFGDYASFIDSDLAKQKKMIALNIAALTELTYRFGRAMRARGSGVIVNVASLAAFVPGPYMAVYYASKAYVLSFSQAVAEELKGSGVSVKAICLGPTVTGFEKNAGMAHCTMFKKIPPARSRDVAKTLVRLAEEKRTVKYHGLPTKVLSFLTRFTPHIVNRKSAAWINGKPPRDEESS